jgi:type IV secretion system protein VirB11
MTERDDIVATIKTRAKERLMRDMGPELLAVLADSHTVEIMLNADGCLWLERLGEGMRRIGEMRQAKAEAIIKTVAAALDQVVNKTHPLVEGELPLDGSRFAGQLPPIVSAPTFAIRKRAIAVFTLDQYVEAGIMKTCHCEALKDAVRQHRNILVTGGTGSGKTTLVNAIINEMVRANPVSAVSAPY